MRKGYEHPKQPFFFFSTFFSLEMRFFVRSIPLRSDMRLFFFLSYLTIRACRSLSSVRLPRFGCGTTFQVHRRRKRCGKIRKKSDRICRESAPGITVEGHWKKKYDLIRLSPGCILRKRRERFYLFMDSLGTQCDCCFRCHFFCRNKSAVTI